MGVRETWEDKGRRQKVRMMGGSEGKDEGGREGKKRKRGRALKKEESISLCVLGG